jgi:hypothetical protein
MTSREVHSGVVGGGGLEPARVVADQGHLAQVQRLQELGFQHRDAAWGRVGVGPHGPPVAAQRQRRHHTVVLAQLADDVAPEQAVHRQSVQQHHDGPVAAGVLVFDGPC